MSLTDWLVSYYKADTGSGTTAFDSVGSNDLTLSNTNIWDINWKIGSCWNFPNNFERISWYFPFFSWSFTISFFAKINNFNVNWLLLGLWFQTDVADIGFYTTSWWVIYTFARDSSWSYTSPSDITGLSNNTWYHITQTWDWSILTNYINWTENANIALASLIDWTDFISIGRINTDERQIDWLIDEVWIWNRALTSTEVSELYNNWDGLQYPFAQPSTKKWNIFFWFGGGKSAEPVNPVPTPVAYYTADTWSWTTLFDSVGTNDWTISWATWTTWKINDWLSFDWSNDYVNLNNKFDFVQQTRTYTIWLWVKFDDYTQDRSNYIFWTNQYSSASTGFLIAYDNRSSQWSPKNLVFAIWRWVNGTEICSFLIWNSILDNNWHYVTATWDWTTARVYLDWIELGNQTFDNTTTNSAYSTAFLWIRPVDLDFAFDWQVDEIWIWNEALTQEQITYLYNNWAWARPNLS